MLPHQLLLLLTTAFVFSTHFALCAQLYNREKEVCCDGTVHIPRRPPNETYGFHCCGSQLHHLDTGVCCDNIVIPYPHNLTDVTPREYSSWGCCKSGDQVNPYNVRTQRCCQANVIDVGTFNRNVDCCANTTFDSSSQLCCGDVIHAIDPLGPWDTSCCGDQLYNRTTHDCCIQPLDQIPVINTDHVVHDKFRYKLQRLPDDPQAKRQLGCCGLQLINTTTEVCCDDNPNRITINTTDHHCCGKKLLRDGANEVCCKPGVIRVRDNQNQSCCGEVLFNREHEECCGDRVTTKAANKLCCAEAGQLYDPTTHACCDGQPMPLPTNHKDAFDKIECCRGAPKDTIFK